MEYLLYLSMLLLLGTIFTFVAKKLKVSSIFFLVLAGLVLGLTGLFELPLEFFEVVSIITLVIVVFDSIASLNFKGLLKSSKAALAYVAAYFAANLALTGLAAYLILGFFSIEISLMASFIFAAMMFGTDETITLSVLEGRKSKVVEIIEIEALANSPFTLLIPIFLMKLLQNGAAFSTFGREALNLAASIIIPVAVGYVVGSFVVYFLKFDFFKDLAYLLVLTGSVLCYTLSDVFGGTGIFAVIVFAVLFGKSKVVEKEEIEKQDAVIGHVLLIMVFLLLGALIAVESGSRDASELAAGSLVFVIYLLVRLSVVAFMLRELKLKEKVFMALSAPKGVDAAVVILVMMTVFAGVEGMGIVKNMALLFVLYSIVLSTLASSFHSYFLEE